MREKGAFPDGGYGIRPESGAEMAGRMALGLSGVGYGRAAGASLSDAP
jgi:hypothetical protein